MPSLKELNLSEKMDFIGTKWSDIAMVLKEISEKEKPDVNLEVASDRARELWELEEEFYRTALDKV